MTVLVARTAPPRLPRRIERTREAVDAFAAAAAVDPERLSCERCHGWLCVRCLGCHCHVVRCTCAPRQCCGGGVPPMIEALFAVVAAAVILQAAWLLRRSNHALQGLQHTAAAAVAERDGWLNCRLTLVVDGHPYVDATLLQLQTVHCDRNWLEADGELPPMLLVARAGVELTLLQVPPYVSTQTAAVPAAELTGRRRPFGG